MNVARHYPTHLGMWLFLAGEVLLFGALIFAFELAHARTPEAFVEAAKHLHFYHGTFNTALLLFSSYLVAVSLAKKNRALVLISALCGFVFLAVKGHEYWQGHQEGLFQFESMFYVFYLFITLLHALHVTGGIALLLWVWWRMRDQDVSELHENVGLYWHFVDLVWVFVYPIFYLRGH